MTDPKLPPRPPLDKNGHERIEVARMLNEYGLACYRAGQSSAEPMTDMEAANLVAKHWNPAAQWCAMMDAIIEASRRAPVADQRAVPDETRPRAYEWIHSNGHAMLSYDAEWKPFMASQMSEGRASGYVKYPLWAHPPESAAAPTPPAGDQRAVPEEVQLLKEAVVAAAVPLEVLHAVENGPDAKAVLSQSLRFEIANAVNTIRAAIVAAPTPPAGEQDRTLRNVAQAARDWIGSAPHGDNCFVSDHYEGDPGNRCNCGKEALMDALDAVIPTPPEGEQEP